MRLLPWAIILSVVLTGCTESYQLARADREMMDLLSPRMNEVLNERRSTETIPFIKTEPETMFTPASFEHPSLPADRPSDYAGPLVPTLYTLRQCLQLAFDGNREIKNEWEDLYIVALALSTVRHQYDWLPSGTLSASFEGEDFSSKTDRERTQALELAVSKILPTGGKLTLTGVTDITHDSDPSSTDPNGSSSEISLRISQPLLRGAGYLVSHENLTQAQRNLIYAVRVFESARQDLLLSTLERYYRLVDQRIRINNLKTALDAAVYLRKRSEALFQIGKESEIDLLRARENELRRVDSYQIARETYKNDLNSFKSFMGLDITANIDVAVVLPEFAGVEADMQSAIETALLNRLDYKTQQQRVEDTARKIQVTRNALLPQVNLTGEVTLGTNADATSLNDQKFTEREYSALLEVEIPFDRLDERNQLKEAHIRHDQEQRDLLELHDQVVLQVQESIRELRSNRTSLEIARELEKSQERRLRAAEIRFDMGQVQNRDVVEAQQSYLNAQNQAVSALVDYEVARIRLLQRLGILFVLDDGTWEEK